MVSAAACALMASSTRRGSRRDRPQRRGGRDPRPRRRGGRHRPLYRLDGGHPVLGPGHGGILAAAGANAVVLTDGPTGGLVYIADALRAGGLPAGQVQFLGLQRWDVSPEALTQPSLDGGVFATPTRP